MTILKKIEKAAISWNQTKNSKYKKEWYKLIKEWANGSYNIKRRNVSSSASDQADDGRNIFGRKNCNKLF